MEIQFSGPKILYTLPFELPVLGRFQLTETIVMSWVMVGRSTSLYVA